MNGPTTVQQDAWDAFQRHGGDGVPGAATAARIELGKTPGAFASALTGYRIKAGLIPHEKALRPLRASQVVNLLPERLTDIETRLAGLEAAIAALAVLASDLRVDIHQWTTRQPLFVEMRPRHQREVDGGLGGVKERRALRKVAGG